MKWYEYLPFIGILLHLRRLMKYGSPENYNPIREQWFGFYQTISTIILGMIILYIIKQ